jgi:hypothetical protein
MRFAAVNGDREGVATFGDAPSATYYHYFTSMTDIGPTYSVASAGAGLGGGAIGGVAAGEFPPTVLPLSADSAFSAPQPRLQLSQGGARTRIDPSGPPLSNSTLGGNNSIRLESCGAVKSSKSSNK